MLQRGASSTASIRIGIVDDHRLARDGLRCLLAGDPAFVVAGDGCLADADALLGTADVLLVDVRTDAGMVVCVAARRGPSGPPVVLTGADADDEWAVSALQAGASGILGKDADAEELRSAIHVVHRGQIWARTAVVAELVRAVSRSAAARDGEDRLTHRLTGREREILRHAVTGLSNQEIAHGLSISQATVKAHLTRIFQKLEVRDRGQLAARYHGSTPVAARLTG